MEKLKPVVLRSPHRCLSEAEGKGREAGSPSEASCLSVAEGRADSEQGGLPRELDHNGLALLLLPLPTGTLRKDARLIARQALREAIGSLFALPPEAVPLVEGPRGPLLQGAARDIRISLSYAGDWVLIGLAEGRALGVDLVRIEHLPEAEALARLYLPATACQAVLAAPPEARDECFARGWAEMEAGSKCLGLPLGEICAERERDLRACELVECGQVEDYCLAVAVWAGEPLVGLELGRGAR